MFEFLVALATTAAPAVSAAAAPAVPPADPNLALIGSIMGTVGAAVAGILGFLKSGQAKELAQAAGQIGIAGLKKGTEAKGDVKDLLTNLQNLSPTEQAKVIEAAKANIEKQTVEVQVGLEQVRKLLNQKPEFNDEKLNIPREDFDTTPSS